ncbi:MAG: AhpC/TSA family protein, partial [Alistipes sp.]|nr:AhpC/TSA family protein [Alistipes sp.]
MNRLTVTFLAVAALALSGCRSSKVIISGRFVGNDVATVYLEQVTPLAQTVIDSATLDAGGNYRFRLKTAPHSPA